MTGGSRGWRMQLRMLREDLRRDIEQVADLRAVERRRSIIDELLADLDHQLDRSEAAAVITLVGSTGAGKSTLLNAIARQEIAQEGVDRPTTSRATLYAPRDADVGSLLEGLEQGPGAPRVVRYDPADAREGHVFVDAPDMNSIEPSHAERLKDLAQRSDVLLVVLHRQSVVEAAPVEFLDAFARRRGLAFVLNRADELTDEARTALVAQIRELASSRWEAGEAPVIALSARRAREDADAEDGRRLRQTIATLLGGQSVQRIRRHNALGTAAMLAGVFSDVCDDVEEDLQALRTDVGEGVAALARDVADGSDERWGLHRADMNELLLAETARRWEGPGGWALRVGGIEAVGVGAAGALARSHPLLAIGTAVSAAAAAGVRKVTQERRLVESNPMLPAPEELGRSYRAALAPARIRAGRLYGAAEASVVPSQEDALEAVAAAVGSAWRGLVDRDLPRAAERSALRFFRWLIDLPVYALVAWLVYRTAIGFLDDNYVGVDLLLSSALMSGVYLLAVRLLVRAGLRRRARRLLGSAAVASRELLEAWREQVEEELAAREEATRATLERLRRLDAAWLETLSPRGEREAT